MELKKNLKELKKKWALFSILFLTSACIVGFGQPAWSSLLSIAAAFFGYSLFWYALIRLENKKERFFCSFFWFAFVELVHLSWMSATRFHGAYILLVYFGVIVWLATQFALFCLLIKKQMSILWLCMLAGVWTLIEYSRLFFFCGFAFDPMGIHLSSYPVLTAFASVFGVYGLSYLVVLVNLFGFRWLLEKTRLNAVTYFSLLLIVVGLGVSHVYFHDEMAKKSSKKTLDVALVQTGLRPDQKIKLANLEHHYVSPYTQWLSVLSYLKKENPRNLDLIVFPEAAIPFGAKQYPYHLEDAMTILEMAFGEIDNQSLPPKEEPFAKQREDVWYVSNSFFAQTLSNIYQSEVLIGLNDYDRDTKKHYNAAFHFYPDQIKNIERYEKRILVPLGEYLPIKSLENLVAKYGITGFSEHGKSAKLFGSKAKIFPSICYEECFSNLMRDGKKLGAEVYVNMTNDAWYYPSKLPLQHFYHARIRAVENGVPLLRSCNTGVTAAVDSLGRIRSRLSSSVYEMQNLKGALVFSLDLYQHFTIYTVLGDWLILILSVFSVLNCFLRRMPKGFLPYIPYR